MHPTIHGFNSRERSRDLIARAEKSRLARAGRRRLAIWERLLRRRRFLVTRPAPAKMPPSRTTPRAIPDAGEPVGHGSTNGRATSMRR
jgi:hypothetical protein